MATEPATGSYAAYAVWWVGFFLAVPLWCAFREPGQPVWNVLLGAFLIALVIGTFVGIRYLQKNRIEVGEARFPTRPPT